jgi:hypothetical protein
MLRSTLQTKFINTLKFLNMKNMNPELTEDNQIIAEGSGGGKSFEPIPEGDQLARCVKMIHLGRVPNIYQDGKIQKKVILTFEFPEHLIESDNEDWNGKPSMISNDYTLSLHEKATLRKHLDKWRGKDFTEEEAKAFNVSKLIGQPCVIYIEHSKSKDGTKTYANIDKIKPAKAEAPEQLTQGLIINIMNLPEHWETLSDYTKKQFEASLDFQEAYPNGIETSEAPTETTAEVADETNDDLPF